MNVSHYFGLTDIGKKRANNEDSFICQSLHGEDVIIACAIDGVGGYEGGEIAAAITNETILNRLNQPFANKKDVLVEALLLSNSAIAKEKMVTQQNERMSCVVTLVLADINVNKFYFAHVGDTRLYLLRDKTLVKISKDQSFVGFLEDSGKLSENEAMRHPKRNLINNALGFNNEIQAEDYIDSGESPFLPGDLLMLCTDGLTDLVNHEAMQNILVSELSVQQKVEGLVEAANNAGGKDNITVVVVHHHKQSANSTQYINQVQSNASIIRVENTVKINENVEKKTNEPKHVSNFSAVTKAFFLIGILLITSLVWMFYSNRNKSQPFEKALSKLDVRTERNAQEQIILDSLSALTTGKVLVLHSTGSLPISLTDSIHIHRDTLHILGNGVIINSDTHFNGPAFVIDSTCKQIIFDSITFQNFEVAFIAYSKALQLKQVKFINCNIPVQYGNIISDIIPIRSSTADSVIQINQKP